MGQNIEQLFRDACGGETSEPPHQVWDNISSKLDEESVERLYRKTYENSSESVPPGIWFKIQSRLFIRDFLRFVPGQINIYYTAATVAVIAGLLWNGNTLLPHDKPANVIPSPLLTKENVQAAPAKQLSATKPPHSDNPQISKPTNINNSPTEHKQTKQRVAIKQGGTYASANIAPVGHKESILGDTIVCVSSEHIYTLNGIGNEAKVEWKTSPKHAILEPLPNNRVSIDWKKATEGKIIAEITLKDGSKHSISLPVSVITAPVPSINGDNRVCEGTCKSYSISNETDLNMMYTWATSHNKYTVKSNGFISVEWKNPGYDTIRATSIHAVTGCVVQSVIPIIVFSKPEPDFKTTDNGNGDINFTSTSLCGKKSINCKLICTWTINETQYKGNNVSVVFKDRGTYPIVLEVQNEFGCRVSHSRDISLEINKLFVPNAFASSTGNFIPTGENLSSYHIEIFNSANKKLWESTLLADGSPSEGWDGTANGVKQEKGTYQWRITATFNDGTPWKGVYQKGQYQTQGTFFLME